MSVFDTKSKEAILQAATEVFCNEEVSDEEFSSFIRKLHESREKALSKVQAQKQSKASEPLPELDDPFRMGADRLEEIKNDLKESIVSGIVSTYQKAKVQQIPYQETQENGSDSSEDSSGGEFLPAKLRDGSSSGRSGSRSASPRERNSSTFQPPSCLDPLDSSGTHPGERYENKPPNQRLVPQPGNSGSAGASDEETVTTESKTSSTEDDINFVLDVQRPESPLTSQPVRSPQPRKLSRRAQSLQDVQDDVESSSGKHPLNSRYRRSVSEILGDESRPLTRSYSFKEIAALRTAGCGESEADPVIDCRASVEPPTQGPNGTAETNTDDVLDPVFVSRVHDSGKKRRSKSKSSRSPLRRVMTGSRSPKASPSLSESKSSKHAVRKKLEPESDVDSLPDSPTNSYKRATSWRISSPSQIAKAEPRRYSLDVNHSGVVRRRLSGSPRRQSMGHVGALQSPHTPRLKLKMQVRSARRMSASNSLRSKTEKETAGIVSTIEKDIDLQLDELSVPYSPRRRIRKDHSEIREYIQDIVGPKFVKRGASQGAAKARKLSLSSENPELKVERRSTQKDKSRSLSRTRSETFDPEKVLHRRKSRTHSKAPGSGGQQDPVVHERHDRSSSVGRRKHSKRSSSPPPSMDRSGSTSPGLPTRAPRGKSSSGIFHPAPLSETPIKSPRMRKLKSDTSQPARTIENRQGERPKSARSLHRYLGDDSEVEKVRPGVSSKGSKGSGKTLHASIASKPAARPQSSGDSPTGTEWARRSQRMLSELGLAARQKRPQLGKKSTSARFSRNQSNSPSKRRLSGVALNC